MTKLENNNTGVNDVSHLRKSMQVAAFFGLLLLVFAGSSFSTINSEQFPDVIIEVEAEKSENAKLKFVIGGSAKDRITASHRLDLGSDPSAMNAQKTRSVKNEHAEFQRQNRAPPSSG